MARFSKFSQTVEFEGAFEVLAVAKQLQSAGKDVIELEIGDSPFPTPAVAAEAGIRAIRDGQCHYGPCVGLPAFREAASDYVNREYGLATTPENLIAAHGAKPFEQFFCEAFLDPGDGVLVFSPHFPTYGPNIERRQARVITSRLQQSRGFRPSLEDVEQFLAEDPQPKAIFLNSPHNPTGGITLEEDLRRLADLIRGRDIVVFSDEPYDRMVWQGRHHTLLAQEGMLDQCVAAYSFSKSFSMSGWRLGYAVANPETIGIFARLLNSTLSCVPPFVQQAGIAALRQGTDERNRQMTHFRRKVMTLVAGLNRIEGIHCPTPGGSFYAFPSVAAICNSQHITSHGLAMFLLEGADDSTGVACLGGECFGAAGAGFIRFSCAADDDRLTEAVAFIQSAIQRSNRLQQFLATRPQFRLSQPYHESGSAGH